MILERKVMNFQKRLNKVIPGGAHTYSRGFDQFPSNAPQILERGKGAYVFDSKGKSYLDYGMALRAVTVGYSNDRVNNAAINQINNGNNLTRASLVELKAAELFVDLIPGVEMVKFAKNGSNATTAAVKIARSYTGKNYVCVPKQHPFFSYDDWFIGTTPIKKGIPKINYSNSLPFDYNDISSLQNLFHKYPDQIACVILEPATSEVPFPFSPCSLNSKKPTLENNMSHFLKEVREICDKNNALLIADEMITGFRWSIKGASDYFGIKPDLFTFGKAMANGFSVSAVGGKMEIMKVGSIDIEGTERTFLLSTTHGAEMCGLGAFIETVKLYKEKKICDHLWKYGESLRNGINSIAKELEINEYFKMIGPSICLNYLTKDNDLKNCLKFKTLFMQEMAKNKVLIPWIAVSLSHKQNELEITLDAARKSLKIYKDALNNGIDKYLKGPAVKPVFRSIN